MLGKHLIYALRTVKPFLWGTLPGAAMVIDEFRKSVGVAIRRHPFHSTDIMVVLALGRLSPCALLHAHMTSETHSESIANVAGPLTSSLGITGGQPTTHLVRTRCKGGNARERRGRGRGRGRGQKRGNRADLHAPVHDG